LSAALAASVSQAAAGMCSMVMDSFSVLPVHGISA
jgi:hypothetical protein